jgi:sporulation protein YlmC with PRC-barrel domain
MDNIQPEVDGPGPEIMGAGTLIGDPVFNQQYEDLGVIKEIMLNMHTGQVSYAVLDFGGNFLGLGDKYFPVPWAALELDTKNKRFVMNVEKSHLENAPGFDKDHWPNMADPEWALGIDEYYGILPKSIN